MKRTVLATCLLSGFVALARAQSPEPKPTFEATAIHVSAKTTNQFVRTSPVRASRYEIKNGTMVDLIRLAHGFDADKILAGPSWVELDRFDVTGKVPAGSTIDTHKLMLQSLLEDRFKLVVRKDTRLLPTYVLTLGRKHQLREAAGTGETGCRPQSSDAPVPTPGPDGGGGVTRLSMLSASGGPPVVLTLGPGGTIQYQCRNMTMAGFAANLRSMITANLGTSPILDETGLKGSWNFDIKYSLGMTAPTADASPRISMAEAVDKQLGLKLEERGLPTAVLLVESVLRIPTPNAPDVAETLPPIPAPTEFEVASVKMTDPASRGGRVQMQPGGRFVAEGMTLDFLIRRAFNANVSEQVVGVPPFALRDRYDINAKAATDGAAIALDFEATAPLLLSLLKERFKLAYHTEDRPVAAYSLVRTNPKMKKADPASRTWCKTPAPSPSTPPGSRVLTCQNVTMEQFAERLRGLTPEMAWPVADATGLEGTWDLSLTFSIMRQLPAGIGGADRSGGAPNAGGLAPAGGVPAVSDPTGVITIFEAMERQLGLKLDSRKRPMSVIVIDRLEQKPTEE